MRLDIAKCTKCGKVHVGHWLYSSQCSCGNHNWLNGVQMQCRDVTWWKPWTWWKTCWHTIWLS